MMGQFNEMWGFGMGFGWIFPIVFFGMLIWVLSTRHRNRGGSAGEGDEDALAILKKRYAKGELSAEDFQRMKRELE